MFNQLKSRILGPKAGNNRGNSKSANPYADIPIFDDVGSIGMPGFDSTSRDESKHADSPNQRMLFHHYVNENYMIIQKEKVLVSAHVNNYQKILKVYFKIKKMYLKYLKFRIIIVISFKWKNHSRMI